jgi:hypothetical protein
MLSSRMSEEPYTCCNIEMFTEQEINHQSLLARLFDTGKAIGLSL